MMKNDGKKSNDVIVLKKDTIVSVLITSILVLSVMFIGILFIKNIQYNAALTTNGNILSSAKVSYSDTYLNILVNFPKEWALAEIDLTDTANVVKESALEENFNMEKHTLTREVISCMLVGNQSSTGGFGKFVSLSFKGDDSKRGEELKQSLSELLKQEIIATEAENVEITKVELIDNKSVYLEAQCTLNGATIYYTQYTTLVGKNFGTALLGTRTVDKNSYNDVVNLLNDIIIQNVTGTTTIPTITETDEVTGTVESTTNNVNPNGFQIGR